MDRGRVVASAAWTVPPGSRLAQLGIVDRIETVALGVPGSVAVFDSRVRVHLVDGRCAVFLLDRARAWQRAENRVDLHGLIAQWVAVWFRPLTAAELAELGDA